jgi:hypothetical protein
MEGRAVTDYNGWTNWATWNVYVWLTNEPDVYEAARIAAAKGSIACLRDLAHHCTGAVCGDGVNLPEVNWPEIVEGLKEET